MYTTRNTFLQGMEITNRPVSNTTLTKLCVNNTNPWKTPAADKKISPLEWRLNVTTEKNDTCREFSVTAKKKFSLSKRKVLSEQTITNSITSWLMTHENYVLKKSHIIAPKEQNTVYNICKKLLIAWIKSKVIFKLFYVTLRWITE